MQNRTRPFPKTVAEPAAPPPSPLQIVEAMLFIGGPPLTAEKACSAIRGLTAERFRELVDELARNYRKQNRPYAVQPREAGWVLALRSQYRGVLEKLYGGPKEARLNQPAIDVLSLVAYRQPIAKAELDTARGADSGAVLRQLVRLGLVASAGITGYETTARFLELFGLRTLDDLPRLGDGKM
jgi:segregation and condensation protein B